MAEIKKSKNQNHLSPFCCRFLRCPLLFCTVWASEAAVLRSINIDPNTCSVLYLLMEQVCVTVHHGNTQMKFSAAQTKQWIGSLPSNRVPAWKYHFTASYTDAVCLSRGPNQAKKWNIRAHLLKEILQIQHAYSSICQRLIKYDCTASHAAKKAQFLEGGSIWTLLLCFWYPCRDAGGFRVAGQLAY